MQDEIPAEVDANANARQSLDEISKQVNEMKADITKTSDANDPVSDGDGGYSQRAALGEIEKIKKIAEILETIILPTIVNRQNAQEQAQNKGAESSATAADPIKILPKGFKLLQHHNPIASIADDGGQTVFNQKPTNPQSDDNWLHSNCVHHLERFIRTRLNERQ